MESILLVDDEPDITAALAALLQLELPDVKVTTAPDAASALEILAKETPTLIVSDYQMPGLNGIEFLTEVKNRHGDIPTILLTAFNERQKAVVAAQQGIVKRFFMKPPDVPALIAGITELMRPGELSTDES